MQAALVVIDVQKSFEKLPDWEEAVAAPFFRKQQALIDGARELGIPVVQILHVDADEFFTLASGCVKAPEGLSITPDVTFYKNRHSALVGTGLSAWLVEHGIDRLIISGIRTEQCCETTARHASDSGYKIDYVTEATLTFAMTDRHGRSWSPEEIKARTELVLNERFARIVTVNEALAAVREEVTV